MIPRIPQGLADIAAKLMTSIAPETTSGFAMANTGMITMLLMALAQETERAVASRMADVDAMKVLLGAAGGDAPHADARAAFAEKAPASLALSDVDALHGEGLALLIDVHGWAEDHDDALNRRIWDFLRDHTERHRLDLA